MAAEKKDDSAMGGLEKFNKNFLPYLLIAFGLIQYIYTNNQSDKQGILVEIRNEQKQIKKDLEPIATRLAVIDSQTENARKEREAISKRIDAVETRLSNFEKSQMLGNGNHR